MRQREDGMGVETRRVEKKAEFRTPFARCENSSVRTKSNGDWRLSRYVAADVPACQDDPRPHLEDAGLVDDRGAGRAVGQRKQLVGQLPGVPGVEKRVVIVRQHQRARKVAGGEWALAAIRVQPDPTRECRDRPLAMEFRFGV